MCYVIINLSCTEYNLFKKNSNKHIDIKRKYKEEMAEVHDNVNAIMNRNIKTNS